MENRTQTLKKRLLDAPYEVCAERTVLWTESQRNTEGKPQVIRNALALKHVLENMTVSIGDGELVVGNRSSKIKGSPLFPETKSLGIETQLDSWDSRPIQPYRVSDSDKRELKKILPYWRGRSAWDMAFRLMPRDLQTDVFALMFTVEAEFANGIGHFIVGNNKLIEMGFAGIREDAVNKLRSSNGAKAGDDKDFWEACVITSDAAMAFAGRFAAEARRLLARENDPKRKDELLRIAIACDRVPANPPKNFHEAVQAVWFNQLICQLECGGFAISPGRLDQILYPFYKRDVLQGRLTPEKAREFIECLFVKLSGVVNVMDTLILPVSSGPPIAQSLTIGGVDRDGRDATNELSYIFIEALDKIRTVSPNMAVRFHPGTPGEFAKLVCDCARRGAAMALFGDNVIVAAMRKSGVTIEDARDYAIVGCVEPAAPGKTFGSTDSNLVNIARCLELALHNGDAMDLLGDGNYLSRKLNTYYKTSNGGRAKGARKLSQAVMLARYMARMAKQTRLDIKDLYEKFRGRGVGPRTGEPRMFKSIGDLMDAYGKQVSHFVARMVAAMEYCDMAHAALKPTPFISSCIDDCIGRGKDVTWGGARYNFTGPQAVGLAEVADSLAAVKKLVFDEGRYSMSELVGALKNDFKDAEPMRQTLLNKAPKYGNDDEAADELARQAAEIYCNEVAKHKNYRGGSYQPGIYSMSAHIVFGILTGATPDGRRKGDQLAAGVSPHRGREANGPTAVLKSAAKVDNTLVSNGCVLNMSFDPKLVEGDEKLKKFVDLNRAYFDMGGLHVQYNIIDAATLREAQTNPELHRGLVVRVAGYSALFTQLDRATQNDIIARIAHGC